jgi:hypothetical protein
LRSSSRRSESTWEFDPFKAIASRNGVSMRKGQAVLAARDHVVTNRRHGGLPADLSVAFVEP